MYHPEIKAHRLRPVGRTQEPREHQMHPWAGDWMATVTSEAIALGYTGVTELLAAHPAIPYADVARKLGPFAPIQVIACQFREATTPAAMRLAAMDCLARNVVETFPDGWKTGEKADWRATAALSGWSSEISVTGHCGAPKDRIQAIKKELRDNAPVGWKPTGPGDAVIAEVFDRYWPEVRGDGHSVAAGE